MKKHILSAFRLTFVLLLLLAVVYPLGIRALAFLLPGRGYGQTIVYQGKTYYSNVGQHFSSDRYFNGRPSATGYNAAASGGSNKGPMDSAYLASVQDRIDSFIVHNPGVRRSAIPVELVTASGSGIDPDISPAAARVQAHRIATLRGLQEQRIQQLINQHIEQPLFGLFGPQRINVLQLNIDLDQLNNDK